MVEFQDVTEEEVENLENKTDEEEKAEKNDSIDNEVDPYSGLECPVSYFYIFSICF